MLALLGCPLSLSVGPACAAQLDGIASLCVDSFVALSFPTALTRPRALTQWKGKLESRLDTPSFQLLVATEEDEKLVGCAEVGLLPPPPLKAPDPTQPKLPTPDVPYIANVAVLPEERRRGVGRRLVEAAEELSQRWGHEAVFIKVDRSNIAALAMPIVWEHQFACGKGCAIALFM
ncbi:MAG: hypothetical protein SGPRY_011344 [Prymnesium sp.]